MNCISKPVDEDLHLAGDIINIDRRAEHNPAGSLHTLIEMEEDLTIFFYLPSVAVLPCLIRIKIMEVVYTLGEYSVQDCSTGFSGFFPTAAQ